MILPHATARGWYVMILPPTKFTRRPKVAHLKIVDGKIVNAFARERYSHAEAVAPRRLHWAADLGSWTEVA